MPDPTNLNLLEPILDSWDRNNSIAVNLLRALPDGGLEFRAAADSPSVAEMFTHMHFVRLIIVSEDAPEIATAVPDREWLAERDPQRIAQMLDESAKTVRDAVRGRLEAGRAMDQHYDHPILMLQHLIWHEGYHHGQIKLVLKISGRPLSNDAIGRGTWGIWMDKRES